MFIDQAKIFIQSGKGGDGAVSFRREKYVPRGGPDGGDGGKGGDVIFVAENRMRTLLRFRYERRFVAIDGGKGTGNNCHGKNGKDIIVKVPVGTVVYELGHDEPLVDLNRDGMKAVMTRGGRGGRGNQHYATPSRQIPRFAEKGEPGEAYELRLELKLLADVGLIGLPNAGKSTLLSRVSAATPKIADYPFTTLEPQLGVVAVGNTERSFVMADLPGLIEGAAQGRGKGTDFLRHAQRSRVLLHIVDVSGGFGGELDPWESFLTINREIALYGAGLERLPMLVALNKVDLPTAEEYLPDMIRNLERAGYRYFSISAVTGDGVTELLFAIDAILREQEEAEEAPEEQPQRVVVRRARRELEILMTDEGVWEVTGSGIERLLAMTDLNNEEAVSRLQNSLVRMGVVAALRERGAQEGDTILIGGKELEFVE